MDENFMQALTASEGMVPSSKNVIRLASQFGESAARWALEQHALRRRGAAKFANASTMLFDGEGLEMATHEAVSAYHASRFPKGEKVADLTAGLGADLVALAGRGPATGFESDPQRAGYARHNLQAHGLSAEVAVADCLTADWAFRYAFADPARRSGSRRTRNPDDFQPQLGPLAERMGGLELGLIKTTPFLPDVLLGELGWRVEFVSFGWECREALLYLGEGRAFPDGVWAVQIQNDKPLRGGIPLDQGVEEPKEFLFEADPAAIRAHALGSLGTEFGLQALGDSNGYLTGNRPVGSPWLKCFRVVWCGTADRKKTQLALKALGGRIQAVKTRGSARSAEQIQKEFRPEGERPLVLAVWPFGRSLRHALAELAH